MPQDSATVLESCLREISAGKATVQGCLDRHPDLADELEPLLRAAARVRAIDRRRLTPAARARIEARLLDAAASAPSVQPARGLHPTTRLIWVGAAVGLVLLFACTCFLGAGSVAAASNALPDSPLYPVKQVTEEAWLWLTPAEDKPALRLHLAGRRLDEAQALAERGRFDAMVLTALTEETAAALTGIETLPPEAARPMLQEFLRVTTEQGKVLPALMAHAPASQWSEFARALQASRAHGVRALRLLAALHLPGEPGDSGQATPASVPTLPADATPSLPQKPEPPSTSAPSLTPTAAGAPGTPTDLPQPTATPQATSPPESTDVATPRPSETPIPPTAAPQPTERAILPTATTTTAPSTATPGGQGCVYGLGYWKRHPDVWPVNTLALGSETYTQAELLDLLNRPTKGDASLILARHLIAAKQNVASGVDPSTIAGPIAAADTWLAGYAGPLPYDVSPRLAEGQEAVALASTLEQYNDGVLPGGPPSCP